MTPERRQALEESLDNLQYLSHLIQDVLNGNMSQTQLATRLGVTSQSVSNDIRNHFLPRLHKIQALSTENLIHLLQDCETPYEKLVKDIFGLHNLHPNTVFLVPEDTEEILHRLIDEQLNDQQKEILTMRYGLNDQPPMSLQEIGATKGVTRERIRQIIAKTLRKLRHPNVWHQLLRNYPMYIKTLDDIDQFKTINESYFNKYNAAVEEFKHLQHNVHFVKEMDNILKEHQLTYLIEPLSAYAGTTLTQEEVDLLQTYQITTIGDIAHMNSHVYLTCYSQLESIQSIYRRLQISVPESIQLLQESIDILDLSIRTYNCLKHQHIHYISDLIICTKTDIQNIPYMGVKCFDELCTKMEKYHLEFRPS